MNLRGNGVAVDSVLAALARAGCAPRRSGRGWQSRCPVHDDQGPNMSLAEGHDGRVQVKCWARCETAVVLEPNILTRWGRS